MYDDLFILVPAHSLILRFLLFPSFVLVRYGLSIITAWLYIFLL
jgi:hypothetical protein